MQRGIQRPFFSAEKILFEEVYSMNSSALRRLQNNFEIDCVLGEVGYDRREPVDRTGVHR